MLHPHEMVVPRDMAEAIRSSIKGTSGGPASVQDNRNFTVIVQGPSRGIDARGAADELRRVAALV